LRLGDGAAASNGRSRLAQHEEDLTYA